MCDVGPVNSRAISLRDLGQKGLPLALLALALVAVPWMILSPTGLPTLRLLKAEREQLVLEASRLQQEIGQLREAVERAKVDPLAVERTARDEFGLVRRSEVVFQFEK